MMVKELTRPAAWSPALSAARADGGRDRRAWTCNGRFTVETPARSEGAAVPPRPRHRGHAGAAGRHGDRSLRRSPRWRSRPAGTSRRSKTSTSWRRSSFIAASRATSQWKRNSMRVTRGLAAECRLSGRRQLPGQAEPQVTTHFTGRVRLTRQTPREAASRVRADGEPTARRLPRNRFTASTSTGPRTRCWSGPGGPEGAVGGMAAGLPDNHVPAAQPLALAPRLIELCFQTAGIWEMAVERRMGLPRSLASVRLYPTPDAAAGPLYRRGYSRCRPRAASTRWWWIRREPAICGWPVTAPSRSARVSMPRIPGGGAGRWHEVEVYWLAQDRDGVPPDDDWLSERESRVSPLPHHRSGGPTGAWAAGPRSCAIAACRGLTPQPQALAAIEVRPAPTGAPEAFFRGQPAGVDALAQP